MIITLGYALICLTPFGVWDWTFLPYLLLIDFIIIFVLTKLKWNTQRKK